MIYTVTLNPSVDYVVKVIPFELGHLNRAKSEAKFPGGKGINVSRVLKRLNVESCALGFLGGFTGKYIETFLKNEGIQTNFVHVNGDTRINIKLKTDVETEINGIGPMVSHEEMNQFLKKVDSLTSSDLLIMSGSVPKNLPDHIYEQIAAICQKNNVKLFVDISGDVIHTLLPYQPFLIKPNHLELGEWFNCKINSIEEALYYGKKLVKKGAHNVIVSMAEKGALLINKELSLYASVPVGEVKNSVGAGDSVVAGFIAKYIQTNDIKLAFQYGIAAGSATAFSFELCKHQEVEALHSKISIEVLEGGRS